MKRRWISRVRRPTVLDDYRSNCLLKKTITTKYHLCLFSSCPSGCHNQVNKCPQSPKPPPHRCPHQSRVGSACPNLSSSFSSSQTQQFSHRMSMKETQLTVKHWQMASRKFGLNWENTVHHFYLTIYVQIWNDAYIATCHEKKIYAEETQTGD